MDDHIEELDKIVLPGLKECLNGSTYRRLFQVMRVQGFSPSTRWRKKLIVDFLYVRMKEKDFIVPVLDDLEQAEKDCLKFLADSGGGVFRELFEKEFGSIPRDLEVPEQADVRSPRLSVTAKLWFRGLIFNYPREDFPYREWVLVPDAVYSIVKKLLAVQKQEEAGIIEIKPWDFLHHIALFMACIAHRPVKVRSGRWMTAASIREYLSRLDGMPSAGFSRRGIMWDEITVRSEKQFAYLMFIHYLAEYAGLIGAACGRLIITNTGYQWLSMPVLDRYAFIMDSWLGSSLADGEFHVPETAETIKRREAAERAFKQPFRYDRPYYAEKRMLELASGLPTRRWRPYPRFLRQASLDLRNKTWMKNYRVFHKVHRFITGPLFWSGLIKLGRLRDEHRTLGIKLSTAGRWYLDRKNEKPPALPKHKPVRMGKGHTLIFPRSSIPLHLVKTVSIARWTKRDGRTGNERTELTKESLTEAAARGMSLNEITAVIEEATEKAVSRRVAAMIRAGVKAGSKFKVTLKTLIETDNPKTMRRLRNNRVLGKYIVKQYSRTVGELDSNRIESFRMAAAKQRFHPRFDMPEEKIKPDAAMPDPSGLLTAALVCRELQISLKLRRVSRSRRSMIWSPGCRGWRQNRRYAAPGRLWRR